MGVRALGSDTLLHRSKTSSLPSARVVAEMLISATTYPEVRPLLLDQTSSETTPAVASDGGGQAAARRQAMSSRGHLTSGRLIASGRRRARHPPRSGRR